MIEIPESATIGKQASETLKGKRIAHVIESNSPHRFTFYNGDPAEYSNRLVGRNQYALLYLRGKGPEEISAYDRIRGRLVPSFHGFDVWFHLRFQRRV